MPMYHDAEQQKLDMERAKNGICPECLTDLKGTDVAAHAETEFDELTLRNNPVSDAHRRKALLLTYAKLHPYKLPLDPKDPRQSLTAEIEQAMQPATANAVATQS